MNRRVRRRLASAAAPDAGLSLVELAVAMFIASILLGGVATVFIGTLRASRTVNVKTSTGADARLASEAMSRTLKVATAPYGENSAFVSATATDMSFYALLNRTGSASAAEPVATLVTYAWSSAANCLYESQTPGLAISSPASGGPYFTWPASARKSKCLLRTTSAPSFSYYASYTNASTNTPTSSLPQIRNVLVTLMATDPNNTAVSGVPTETLISLENLINADG
jgi:type II secretory pathway component PulJ